MKNKIISLIGKKIGMTRVFNNDGLSIPVSVIEINDNIITCIKNLNVDGYNAVQVTFGFKKNVNKVMLSYFSKIGINPGIGLWEIPYLKDIHLKIGQKLCINLFCGIKKVDITGVSKGKGFSGTIKRWNFSSQDKTHGNSLSHRAPGSIGQNQTPGRVFKGKKMSGQMGNKFVTVQGLSIIKIYIEKNILLVKGSIPGFNNSIVYVKSSIK